MKKLSKQGGFFRARLDYDSRLLVQFVSTPLVFSVHEAKGLEYDSVILYDIVSSERAAHRELTSGVTQADIDTDALAYSRAKDKSDKSLEAYKFFVNALHAAVTRAVETVYIVESDDARPLFGLLRVTFSDDVSRFTAKASTVEEWQKEARKLELQGKTEQAEAKVHSERDDARACSDAGRGRVTSVPSMISATRCSGTASSSS